MSYAHVRPVLRELMHRLCRASMCGESFGLVAEFRNRVQWIKQPLDARADGNVGDLYVFMRAIEREDYSEPDMEEQAALLALNEGLPHAVRALNVIEHREGNDRHWRDSHPGL